MIDINTEVIKKKFGDKKMARRYMRRKKSPGKWRVAGLKRFGKLIRYKSKRSANRAKRGTGVKGRVYKVR